MASKGKRPTHPPSGLTKELAIEDIKEMFKQAKADLRDVGVTESLGLETPLTVVTYYHVNADETVDAEFRVTDLPEDVEAVSILTVMADRVFKPLNGFWSTVGVRFGDPLDEELSDRYTRYRGLNQESTYYARMGNGYLRLDYQFLTMRLIIERMQGAGIPRPQQIYMRIHWNKWNTKPSARYDRRVTK